MGARDAVAAKTRKVPTSQERILQGEVTDFGGRAHENWKESARILDTELCRVAIVWRGVLKTTAAMFLSPLFGLVLALALILTASWIFVRKTPLAADRVFRVLQFGSAAMYSLTAAMTLRKRWVSSPGCCSRTAISARSSMSRFGWSLAVMQP